MWDFRTSRLGAWAWIALLLACGTVVFADANRYLPPGAERFANRLGAGGADLLPSFNSAHALLARQSPYHYTLGHLPPTLTYEGFKYQYPPTHALLYVPLAWYAGKDFAQAGRVHFYVSLLAVLVLAWAVVDLIGAAVPLGADLRAAMLALVGYVLTLNPGSQLGFERGQSDVFTAAFCWSSAALFLRQRYAASAFLACAGALLKGYGVPFAAGLLLLGMRRRSVRPTLVGALLAALVLIAPVARHMGEAVGAFRTRAQMFWTGWTNQSLYNLLYTLDVGEAKLVHKWLIGFAAMVTLLTWLRMHRLLATPAPVERAIALGMYACASLIFILSFSMNALSYDSILVLPGALFLAATQLRQPCRSALGRGLTGVWLALCLFGLFAMSAPRLLGRIPTGPELPLHALGQLALLLWIATLTLLHWPKRLRATEPAHGLSAPQPR